MDKKTLDLRIKAEMLKANNGFPLSKHQERAIYKKAKTKIINQNFLEEFIEFLSRYNINLKNPSIKQNCILFSIFQKERLGLNRTQTERNILKELISKMY